METVTKLVTIIGSVITVVGLFGALTGLYTFYRGQKNDNPDLVDKGINSMILGGIVGVVAGGLTATIITNLNSIKF